ncbi:MAG: hypothetical protein FWD67_03770 [Betaproteobacteria bacterium]|nr:hypothetical protein [Betaproteobacteria bacterium]
MSARKVEIVVTSTVVGQYEARSYPHTPVDSTGYYNLYRVPVYKILVKGVDDVKQPQTKMFMAPRFMPYFNDPKNPDRGYKAKGWLNCGLSSARTVAVTRYIQNYEMHNRISAYRGAIVVHQTFYIHPGPATVCDYGFGSAGCIEIIGNFDVFKEAIASLSGITSGTSGDVIQKLVNDRKLIVIIETAPVPDIRNSFSRQVHGSQRFSGNCRQ